MEDSLKQDFQRRLSQCNKGEMIVIMYDITFAYLDEAKKAHEIGDYENYKTAIKKGQNSIDTLMQALDFSYEISKELYRLYVTAKNMLAKAIYQNRTDGIIDAERVLKPLYGSFCEAAKSDTSGPLMRNTQAVYAGMTYGKSDLNENFTGDYNRGFLA